MPYPPSDHFDGERFYNLDRSKTIRKGFRDLLKWRLSGGPRGEWPERAAFPTRSSAPCITA